MQIRRELVPSMTIEEFAERHGLTMVVTERRMDYWQRQNDLRRFVAHFDHAEVSEGGMLASRYGEGDSEADAIRNYAEHITGCNLVVNAMQPTRVEIRVPRLIEPPPAVDAVDPVLPARGTDQ